jgi:hypothetical protein
MQEASIRRLARESGYRITKSRRQVDDLDNFGGYVLIDNETNGVVMESRYSASLDEIEHWLRH